MKTISKRALSVLLAVLMVISVFTVIPLTASAGVEDGIPTPVETYDVVASCTITAADNETAPSTLYDTALEGDGLFKRSNGTWPWDVYIVLPENVTFRGVRMIMEHDAGYVYITEGRSVSVTMSTSKTQDTADPPSASDWTPIDSNVETTFIDGYHKVIDKGVADSGVTMVKLSLSDPKKNGEDGSTMWPAIAELQVFADPPETVMNGIENLTAKALYKSNVIEFDVPHDDATYTVEYNDMGTGEEWNQLPACNYFDNSNAAITKVTVNDRDYYTFLHEVGALSRDNYVYRVQKTASGVDAATTVGTVYSMEDCSMAALRRNSLISRDYGINGKVFDANGENKETLTNDPVLLAKIKALKWGTILAVAQPSPSATGNMRFVSFGTTYFGLTGDRKFHFSAPNCTQDLDVDYNNTKIDSIRDNLPHSFLMEASCYGGGSNIGGIFLRCDGVNNTNMMYSNQTNSKRDDLTADSCNEIVIGGSGSGDNFTGTLYSLLVSYECYSPSTIPEGVKFPEVTHISEVPSKFELKRLIDLNKEYADKYQSFYTEESLEKYNAVIGAAEHYIEDLDGGLALERAAVTYKKALDNIRSLLESKYYSVSVVAGPGVDPQYLQIEHTPHPGTDDDPNESDYKLDGMSYNFAAGTEHDVTVTVTQNGIQAANDLDLTFDGWYINGSRVSQENPYTFHVNTDKTDENVRISARFTGFNGEISEAKKDDNLKLIDDYATLQENASANSWEGQETAGYGNDWFPKYAFDGVTGANESQQDQKYRWHSNYQTQNDANNPIITLTGSVGQDTIWVQSGIGDDNDSKLIGGIAYIASGREKIKDYEVWTSDNKVMGDYIGDDGEPHYNAYTIAASGQFGDGTAPQDDAINYVLFDGPVKAKYVRLVAKSTYGGGYASADELQIFEYIGDEVKDAGELKVVDDEGNTLGTVPSDAHKAINNESFDGFYVDETEGQAAMASVMDDFSTLSKNYTLSFDADNQQIKAASSTAQYTLTVNNADSDAATQTKDYDTYFDYTLTVPEGKTFKYWKVYEEADNAGLKDHIIGVGSTFNYRANENLNIIAEYDTDIAAGAYIPQPVVSRTSDNKWLAEIPVSFFKADDAADYGDDYGIVIVDKDAGEAAAKNVVNGTTPEDNNQKKFSAKDTNLNNKGRYLHKITFSDLSKAKDVYAYVKVGNEVTLSNVRTIAAR